MALPSYQSIVKKDEKRKLPSYSDVVKKGKLPKFSEVVKPSKQPYTRLRERTTAEAGERIKRGETTSLDALLSSLMTGVTFGAGSEKVWETMPEHTAANIIGTIGGSALPIGRLYKGAKLLTKPITSGIGKIAATGALASAGLGAGKATLEGQPLGEIGKEAAIYGALGAVADPLIEKVALPLIKKGFQKSVDALFGKYKANQITKQQLEAELKSLDERILNLQKAEEGQKLLNKNYRAPKPITQLDDELARELNERAGITGSTPVKQTKEIKLPDINLSRGYSVVNPAETQLERLFNLAKSRKLTPGREREELEDLWSSIAPYEAGSLDNLIEQSTQPLNIKQFIDRIKQSQKYGVYPIENIPKKSVTKQVQINPEPNFAMRGGALVPVKNPLESLLKQRQQLTEQLGSQKGLISDFLNFTSKSKSAIEKPVSTTKEVATSVESPNLVQSFRNKINRKPKAEKGTFSQTLEKFRTQFIEDVAPLETLEKKVRGKVASAEDSLYKTARLFRGAPAKANEVVRTRLAPIIENIENQGYSHQDLGDYALAVHARDVNAKGINSGFKNEEIEAVINQFDKPEMEAARQELIKLSDDLLKELADAEVISPKLVAALKEKHPNYMPLFRAFDDDKIEFKAGLSKALANVTSPIKKLEGSSRKVIDPIESMVKNVFQATNAAERNKVALQLSKLAEEDIEGTFIRKIAGSEDTSRKNVVSVLQNGEKVKYEVEPEVYKALLNLDKESGSLLVKLLQKPASILRAGATLTPEFAIRNPLRDINQAFVVSESGFNPLRDFPLGFIDVVFKGKGLDKVGIKSYYTQWLKDNGGYGNIVSMDRNVHREALEKVLKQPLEKRFVNVVSGKSLISLLRSISDITESATKLGEYRAALRSGVSRQEAAYRSRDLMDFARAGYSIREANKMVAFLNANIQGKSKLIRAIKNNPLGVTTRASFSVTLPTMAAYIAQIKLANDTQRKIIEDAPSWLKNTFWLLPIPFTDQVARIPKPFDLAIVFSNPMENLMDYIYKDDPKAFDGFIKESLSESSIPIMLTGLAPIVEGMANYSFFRQAPIIPQREQNLNFPDQYDINTSETGKVIAQFINQITQGEGAFKNFGSPRIIDNTIRGLTAGLGEYAVTGIDAVLKGLGDEELAEKPAKDISQQPLISSFLVNQSSTGESLDQLYKLRDKLRREEGSAKLNKVRFTDTRRLKIAESTTKKISDISKRMRVIQNSKKYTAEEKKELLNELNQKRNEIARNTMDKLK